MIRIRVFLIILVVCDELQHIFQSSKYFSPLQIPDTRTGNDRVDAVVVDEEAVGSGAKILCGDGALDRYLTQHNLKDPVVCYSYAHLTVFFATCPMSVGNGVPKF